jgi:Flp pilus assembly protein TadB
LAIVALVLWAVTAGAGLALLRAGNEARRRSAGPVRPASTQVRYAAVPLTADGKPPPVPRTKVDVPPGEHPLLEFCHPALALVGLACWFLFALVHYRPLAWISLAVLLVTVGAGLTWLAASARAARRQQRATRAFPPRLIALHGLFAATALTLTVIAALSASRG